MADFKKLLDHPEKQTIITKLTSGESPKVVSAYLKDKYQKPDESHLRLSVNLLQEFLDTYADHHGYVQKVIKNEYDSKLDKKIAESLLNNKEWKQRLEESAGKHIDFKERLANLLTIIEARTEQIFDLIQSNPESTKTDYVFTKYLEILMMVIEKGDKLFNDKPDIRIEHSYTVQMVEQQSIAFQEAIRRVLERLGPELTYTFMDLLREEMSKINPGNMIEAVPSAAASLEKNSKILGKVFDKVEEMDTKLLEDDESEVEDE
jgi:hypothetical protein